LSINTARYINACLPGIIHANPSSSSSHRYYLDITEPFVPSKYLLKESNEDDEIRRLARGGIIIIIVIK